jgi:cytochrome c-type biogenesis protein CcmE
MTTGRKLVIAGVVVAGVTGYIAYLGAAASWQYYVTPDECLANPSALRGDRIRVSGKIAPNSLQIAADRRQAAFSLAAEEGRLLVVCSGPLPDNLAENMEVVVEGRLDDGGLLRGEKLLTRCAGKYKSQAPPTPATTAARAGAETVR